MVAKVTQLLDETRDAVERSTSQIPDSARRFSHKGANEPSETSEVANSASPQQAMVLVGALLSLTVLIAVLFIIADRLMKRSRWNRRKTTAHWRRRATAGVGVGDGSTHPPQKDVVRLGWIPAEDFDHWSNVLLQNDTEHERLLLAVSPHH